MQMPRADVLNPFEADELLASARDLLDDAQTRTQITLSGTTSVSVDLEAGTYTPTDSDDTVNALRRTVDAREAEDSAGGLQIGDRIYLIDQADLTGELQTIDEVVDGTDRLSVIRWETDPLDWLYILTARQA